MMYAFKAILFCNIIFLKNLLGFPSSFSKLSFGMQKFPSSTNVEFWQILSLNICYSVAEDSDRQVQHPGHYTALIGNSVDYTESSRKKKGASMDLKTLEWKHMGQGNAGKKGGEKRNGVGTRQKWQKLR